MGISLEFASAGCKIQGKFHPAVGLPPFWTALLLSGLPGNEDDVLELGQLMSQYGINSLTFNYQGTYQSEGTYSLRNTLKDIQAAIEYLHQNDNIHEYKIDTTRLILAGYSYGGGMALTYAANHPGINRIVSIAGTDHGEFAREYKRNPIFAEMIDTVFEGMKYPAGPVHFEGKEVIPKLTQDPDPYDLQLSAPALADREILLIGGWDDSNVTIEHHILPLYRALVSSNALRVRVIALQDDHAFENSREELAQIVADWILAV